MAITDKEQGVWGLDQVYNKINQGGIWDYDGIDAWFCMGKNVYGDLGLNAASPWGDAGRSSPTQLPGTTWSRIHSSGGRGYRGLKTDGTAWAWGYNNAGQLGINLGKWHPSVIVDRSSPTQIGADTTWGSTFSSDDSTTMWIKTDGTLWSWGYNPQGRLGLNDQVLRSSPTQVGTNTTWKDVLAASGCTYAVKTDGTMWSWGTNGRGGLGLNEMGLHPQWLTSRSSPTQVGTDTTWDRLGGCASQLAFAIKTDGTTWSWGYDQYGKLGRNVQLVSLSSPTQLPGSWNHFTQSYSHVLGVKTDGTLWSWGYNQYGPLGQNQAKAQLAALSSPTQIPGTTWNEVAGGYVTSAATKTDGTLWTWGENEGGQLGLNDRGGAPDYLTSRSSPTQVPGTGWSDPSATREEFFVKKLL